MSSSSPAEFDFVLKSQQILKTIEVHFHLVVHIGFLDELSKMMLW